MSLCIVALFSCKSSQQMAKTHHFIIELKEKFSESYIQKKYVDFIPDNIRKISKSKNEYIFTTTISEKQLKNLQALIKADSNIIAFSESKTSLDDRIQTTNQDSKKVKPILKQ
jgi:hypothetical protein